MTDLKLPAKPPPLLLREPASREGSKPKPRSARNLLLGAFKNNWVRPPATATLQIEQVSH